MHERAVEIISGVVVAHTIVGIAVSETGRDRLASFLGGDNLGLQVRGALVDDLQLGQVCVENADNLRDLEICVSEETPIRRGPVLVCDVLVHLPCWSWLM